VTPTDAILALATLVDIIQIKPILFVSHSLGCTRIASTVTLAKFSEKPYVKLNNTTTVAILAFVTLGDKIQTKPILFVFHSLGWTRMVVTFPIESFKKGIYVGKVSAKPLEVLGMAATVSVLALVTFSDMIPIKPIIFV
jgi:hypothetical protein